MNSTIKPSKCRECGSPFHSAMYHRPRKVIGVTSVPKRSKRPKQIGKATLKYNEWRDTVAKPYLDATFGHVCVTCGLGDYGLHILEVEHKLNRGSHPELKMELSNVQWMGREPCHRQKTDRINPDTKKEVTA